MRRRCSAIAGLMSALLMVGPFLDFAHAQGPIYLEIVAEQDYDSPDPLAPFDILFVLHTNGNPVQGLVIPMQLRFTNGNIVGVMHEYPGGDAAVIWSSSSMVAFESRWLNESYGGDPTSPDTMLLGLTSFGAPWKGAGEIFRIHVTPSDTGAITFDTLGHQLTGDFHKPTYFDLWGGVYPDGQLWNPTIHVPPQPGDVRLRVTTHTGTDTIFFGNPATIHVRMDAAGHELSGVSMVFRWTFTNGNILGSISQGAGQVTFSDAVLSAFESVSWNGFNGSPTDTSLVGLVDFNGEGYSTDDVAWSVTFNPTDTGTVLIYSGLDFTVPPICCGSSATDTADDDIPISWMPVRIPVVPCPYPLMGDVTQDGQLTSSDLIYFINYLFKSGPAPLPDRSVGDTNCSGGLTGADIIVLVNYIFKSGAPPCACIVRRI
jgi:hypothetical protein